MNNKHTPCAIGIDLGSNRFVISAIKHGGVEIITNNANYRQTPSLVVYGKLRTTGETAQAQVKQNLKQSINAPQRFLGLLTQEQIQQERKTNFISLSVENNQVNFNVNHEGQNVILKPEQVLASIFTEIKSTLNLNGIEGTEFVISVPSYTTIQERQAILDSAQIAGVKVTRLYQESSATLMNYGIFRKADLHADNARLVGFMDIGYSKTSFFLAQVKKNGAEIIYEITDRNLGVKDLDQNLIEFYTNEFQKKHNEDLFENPKCIYRLRQGIEKQRVVLSSNQEAALSIECLFEDIDYFQTMTREEYQNINKTVFQRFDNFLQQSVKEIQETLKINVADIHSIERIGGGSRIPLMVDIAQQIFGKELSKTLDANESIARGCTIMAAILSPRYSVQSYFIKDYLANPIYIQMQYSGEQNLQEKVLFAQGSDLGKVLSIAIKKKESLRVHLLDSNKNIVIQGEVPDIKSKYEKFEGHLSIELDKNGILRIKDAQLTEHYTIEEKSEGSDTEMKTVHKQHISLLEFKYEQFFGLHEDLIQQFIHEEKRIIGIIDEVNKVSNAKYQLESFIYKIKQEIQDNSNQHFITEQEKSKVLVSIQSNENWLYGEGVNSTYEQYSKRHSELFGGIQNYFDRKNKLAVSREFLTQHENQVRDLQEKHKDTLTQADQEDSSKLNDIFNSMKLDIKKVKDFVEGFCVQVCDTHQFENINTAFKNSVNEVQTIVSGIKRKNFEKKKQEEELKKKEEMEATQNQEGKMETEQ